MTTTAHVTVNAATVSPAKAIAVAVRSGPLVILTGRAFAELCAELGTEAAYRHLIRVATNAGRPIGINAETGKDTSSTAFIAPKGWTEERLRGWVAGRHDEIEAAFGTATVRAS